MLTGEDRVFYSSCSGNRSSSSSGATDWCCQSSGALSATALDAFNAIGGTSTTVATDFPATAAVATANVHETGVNTQHRKYANPTYTPGFITSSSKLSPWEAITAGAAATRHRPRVLGRFTRPTGWVGQRPTPHMWHDDTGSCQVHGKARHSRYWSWICPVLESWTAVARVAFCFTCLGRKVFRARHCTHYIR